MYDILEDPSEERDLAAERPEIAEQAAAIFEREHAESPYFPNPGETLGQWRQRAERQGADLADNINTF